MLINGLCRMEVNKILHLRLSTQFVTQNILTTLGPQNAPWHTEKVILLKQNNNSNDNRQHPFQ